MAKDLIGTPECKTTSKDIEDSKIERLKPLETYMGNTPQIKGD